MAVDVGTNGRNGASAYLDRRLLGGSAVLLTGGFLVFVTGAAVGMAAVVNGYRRYVATLDEPPAQIARRRWVQLRSATSAGVGAWRDYPR